jgi:hypothetical protein
MPTTKPSTTTLSSTGERILSSYRVGTGQDIWIVTGADRNVITIPRVYPVSSPRNLPG